MRTRLVAEPGHVYPAWRDGRRVGNHGPRLHAVTDQWSGQPHHSGFLALCGRPVRFKVEDEFNPDDDQSCEDCAIAIIIANQGDAQ